MKILIAIHNKGIKDTVFNHEAIEKLNAVGDVIWLNDDTLDEEGLSKAVNEYDIILTSWGSPKFTEHVLKKAGRLKFIGHIAGTVVPIVDPYVFETDIKVVNANRVMAYSTAELAVVLMLAGSWELKGFHDRIRQGKWSDNGKGMVPGMYGRTVGLIGYGEISKEVIRLLNPFAPEILVYSGYCEKEEARKVGFTLVSLEELLKRSDIVSLHNTLTPKTRGMIGREQLDMIKDGALVVNTARGPVIQEEPLVEDLIQGRIVYAADVYDQEPLPKDHPFLKLPNVITTPHIGAFSQAWKNKMAFCVAEDIERWIKGDRPEGKVSLEQFKRMTPG